MIQQTSLEAYAQLGPSLGDRQMIIYNALRSMRAGTDYEITYFLKKKDPNFVRPRRNELVKRGIVYCIGKRFCGVTGRMAKVWSIKNAYL